MIKNFFALSCIVLLCSCVNNYEQFYSSHGLENNPRVLYTSGAPDVHLVNTNAIENSLHDLYEQGYLQIGYSSFNASDQSEANLIEFARKVRASKVIYAKAYTDTVSGTMPLTLPDTTTTYHSGSGNVYNSNYTAYGNYSGTSTTYGTTTTYIPFNQKNYDQVAYFLAKRRPGGLGVGIRNLNVEERKLIQSNFGAVIKFVIRDSSAFNANLIEGDIITELDGIKVKSQEHISQIIKSKYDQSNVPLTIIRNNTIYNMVISIDPEFL